MNTKRQIYGQWEPDGVGCGGQYLMTSNDRVYAGVHEIGGLNASGVFECSVWTPGCGFNPQTSKHSDVEAAKAYAANQLAMLMPNFKPPASVARPRRAVWPA
jgi:hypothetical protein